MIVTSQLLIAAFTESIVWLTMSIVDLTDYIVVSSFDIEAETFFIVDLTKSIADPTLSIVNLADYIVVSSFVIEAETFFIVELTKFIVWLSFFIDRWFLMD